MSRLPVHVRPADPADAWALVDLWGAITETEATRLAPPGPDETRRSIARCAADPRECLQVAVVDDAVVGLAHLRRTPVSPLHQDEAVHVTHLFVAPRMRRRGVGRALLAAAAAWADEAGVAHLLTVAGTASRDANRFFACLGLGQTATVRIVPVPVLRQRLTVSEADGVDTPARQARRRVVLRRQINARGKRVGNRLSAHG